MEKIDLIYYSLIELRQYFLQDINENIEKAIREHAIILSKYDIDLIANAIIQYKSTGDRYPFPAAIIKIINDLNSNIDQNFLVEQANISVGNILKILSKFGSYNYKEAKESLSQIEVEAIERIGGWNYLCLSDIDDLGTIRAQLRDILKSLYSFTNSPSKFKLDSPIAKDKLKLLSSTKLNELLGSEFKQLEN